MSRDDFAWVAGLAWDQLPDAQKAILDVGDWTAGCKTGLEISARKYEAAKAEPHKFGPKAADHPSVGTDCLACHNPFTKGDFTALISLGPGNDVEAQERARDGRPYNAVAVEVHWTCATGGLVD